MADRPRSGAAVTAAGDPRPPVFRGPWHYLLWLTVQQRGRAALGATFGTLWMLGLIVPPYALRMAIDHGLLPGMVGPLILWTAILVVVAAVTAWLAIMRHRTMTRVRMDAAFRTIRLVSEHSMRLGHTLGRRGLAGEVAAIGLSDSWVIGRSLTATGPGIGAVVTFLVTAVLLLQASPLLAAVILLGVPVLAVVVGPALSRLTKAQQPYRAQQAALTDQSLDVVGGLQVLNAVGGKALLRRRFEERSTAVRNLGYRVGATVSVIEAMTIALPTLYLAAVVWLAARLAAAGTISIGELVAVYGYAAVLIVPVSFFIEGAVDFAQAMIPARRVIGFLRLTEHTGSAAVPLPTGPQPIVDTVTGVRVDPGSFTAVVTARQSDARAILDRLAAVEPGGLWGGAPMAAMPRDQIRDRLLLNDHDAALFAGSLAANVAGRSGPATMAAGAADPGESVRQAVTVAVGDDVVTGLPGEWEGLLTAGGTNLSGGQRQRIRLARAVAADPEVLLAVDPTSALDAPTESLVAARLRAARGGRTTVVTTTSPLLLDPADVVHLVVDNAVVASGTHLQLMRDPRYYDLVVRGDDAQAS